MSLHKEHILTGKVTRFIDIRDVGFNNVDELKLIESPSTLKGFWLRGAGGIHGS